MRSLRLALRALRREWRSGELALLWLSLCIAVAALTGVGFLVDRIGRAVTLQASEILAADLRIESVSPIPRDQQAQAQQLGLRSARVTTMLSAIFRADNNELADVRAVTAAYPLRGQLTVADRAFAAGVATRAIPAPGEAWPDSRLAAALGVGIGGELDVGLRALRVTRILISRPDQSATFVEFAPALLINEADLPGSGLIQPGSRINYALLLAGPPGVLGAFRRWYRQHAADSERLADIAEASPQIGDASRRAARFLALASLVAVLLCAVAIALSARSYVRRHLDVVALMKTLGATRRTVLAVTLWQLLALALVASMIGAGAGWVTQLWLVRVLRGLLRSSLPPASAWPALVGFGVALAMLAGFALPPLLQLTRVPALRVLRRDVGAPAPGLWLAATPVLLAVFGVVYGALGEIRLSVWFILGLAAAVLALGAGGAALMQAASRVRGYAGTAWRYGIAHLARRRSYGIAQIVAFGLGVMLLLALAILRADLVTDWRASLPVDVPNYFFVNIPARQRDEFQQLLRSQGARFERMLPMLRGRLVAINGEPVQSLRLPGGGRGRGFADREQNLTWTADLGDDNHIVAGRWWTGADYGKPLVSLAAEYQRSMNLKLGDRLRFDIAGEDLTVTIASFRRVQWDSFRPNFFVEFPPGLLEGAAGTYMTSAYLAPTSAAMSDLVHRFPGVSIFNVGDLLAQARAVIDKAVTAVQSVFLFTVLAALTVLLAQVQATREERRVETAIVRVLGARRSMIISSVLVEFALLGALAGVLGASAAALGGAWLAHTLQLNYRFDAAIWGLGVLGSVLICAAAGVIATRPILSVPPRAVLY
ncbi:MAG TPA: FtsX-like permease family protein [Steroidobacteraceae bacterium]|jgi:putative ABC transport system permease protein|nr:FtsX-like permease family protein [Steroidobacteraceae bacterium]